MNEDTDKLVEEKIEQIAAILNDKVVDIRVGKILAYALDKVTPEKGMLSYQLEQIDIYARKISFLKRIEYFGKLFDWLEENGHDKDNSHISEHDSAWFYRYKNHTKNSVRKVIAISNMMGSHSYVFIKEEYFIGEEDYSKYYICRAYDNPDEFFKDCGRKSIRTLAKGYKLTFFEDNYADEDRRWSFDKYESFRHDTDKLRNDYERVVMRYDAHYSSMCNHYFNSLKSCEYALGQLESAFWMRTE